MLVHGKLLLAQVILAIAPAAPMGKRRIQMHPSFPDAPTKTGGGRPPFSFANFSISWKQRAVKVLMYLWMRKSLASRAWNRFWPN